MLWQQKGVKWVTNGSNSGFKAVTQAIQLDEAFNRYKSIFFPHATDPVPDPSDTELVVDVLVPRLIGSCPFFPVLMLLGVKHGHKEGTCRMRRFGQGDLISPKEGCSTKSPSKKTTCWLRFNPIELCSHMLPFFACPEDVTTTLALDVDESYVLETLICRNCHPTWMIRWELWHFFKGII